MGASVITPAATLVFYEANYQNTPAVQCDYVVIHIDDDDDDDDDDET